MAKDRIIFAAKVVIWLCLAVILFSPLYTNSGLFFPFIVTKTVAFNIATVIMFLAFLVLAFKSDDYKIRINLAVVILAVYILISVISSALGDNFYRSFWSNNERSEGILLFIHLFLFFVAMSGFFRKLKDWLYVFDLSFFASLIVSLVALGQYLQISWLLPSSGGQRLAGTIGNAGYMAGYLIFAVFFGLLLMFKRKNNYLKIYYGAVIILEIFIALNTQTRGGILALALGGFVFLLYLLFFYFQDKRLKIIGTVIIILAIIAPFALLAGKNSPLIANNPVLARIANISWSDTTTQNRLMTWNSAWQGFKERPIFGWGNENFYQVFDKNFNPKIYRHVNSVVWFDRAHNIIFDRLIIGGLVGLILYLAFLFVPFYFLWRHYLSREKDLSSADSPTVFKRTRQYFLPILFSLMIISYFIQNLFIFEALVIYIPLFLVLAFVGLFTPHFNWQFLADRRFKLISLIVGLVLFLPVLYYFTYRPLSANIQFAKAFGGMANITVEQRIGLFKSAIAKGTLGNQEYRRQLFNFFQNVAAANTGTDSAIINDLASYTEQELERQLEENPESAANYLLMMRFNNFMFNRTGNIEYVNENFKLFDRAKPLSPTRQQLYFEIGYSYLYLANAYQASGQADIAGPYYQLAEEQFLFALSLNEENFESYRQLSSVYIFSGDNERVLDLINRADQLERKYDKPNFLLQIINTAIPAKNYELIKEIAKLLIEIDPDNPQYYVQLALAHAYLGEEAEAIAAAQKVSSFGAEYEQQSQDFIEKIRRGDFRQ